MGRGAWARVGAAARSVADKTIKSRLNFLRWVIGPLSFDVLDWRLAPIEAAALELKAPATVPDRIGAGPRPRPLHLLTRYILLKRVALDLLAPYIG